MGLKENHPQRFSAELLRMMFVAECIWMEKNYFTTTVQPNSSGILPNCMPVILS